MVPVEVGAGSFRRDYSDEATNMINHKLQLDFIEEVKHTVQLRLAAYQQRTTRYFNGKVKVKLFQVGDLVLKKVMPHTKTTDHRVFGANLEGPIKFGQCHRKKPITCKILTGIES